MNSELRGSIHNNVQQMWPGRLCDKCRYEQRVPPQLATHAYDNQGGGRDFYCDDHNRKR